MANIIVEYYPVLSLAYIFFSYFLGSVSGAYCTVKFFKKQDIRFIGDGNMGAKNVYLNISKPLGILAALWDIFKGIFIMYAGSYFGFYDKIIIQAAFSGFLGHSFPFINHFTGGQGLAITYGMILYKFPVETFTSSLIGFAFMFITRSFDFGCGVLFFFSIFSSFFRGGNTEYLIFFAFLLLLVPLKKVFHPFFLAIFRRVKTKQ